MRTRSQRVLLRLCGILFAAFLLAPALAQNPNDGQNPPNGNPNPQNGARNRRNGNRNRQNRNRNGQNGNQNTTNAQPVAGPDVIQKALPNIQQLPAGSVQEIKRAPIPFQPFPMMNPQTRKPAARTDQITLPDGRTVPAGEYYDQLNALEADLNKRGFSLKSQQKTQALSRTVINRPQLTAQSARIAAAHKPAGPAPMVKFKAPAKNSAISTQLQSRITPADAQAFGLKPNDLQTALTRVDALAPKSTSVGKLYQNAGAIQNDLIIKGIFPGGIHFWPPPPMPTPIPVNYSCPFNWSVGSQSTFEAYLHGQTYIKGTAYQVPNPPTDSALRGIGNQFTLHGDAAAGGAVFGLNIDVLSASADFSASSQQVNANVDVSVLGQSVFNINESDPNSWAQTNQISKGVDFHTTIPIPISIVTLSVTVGAQGQVGLQYSATMDSPMAFVSGSVGPYVQSNVYAQAGVGIGGSWLGVSAGVGGNMTLMNYNMDVEGEVGLLWFINTGLMEKLQVTDSLNLLSGNIYVFAQFNYPCVPDFWNSCSSQISHTLWSWPGFQTNGTLASYNNSHPL